ncbi:hypothetical protein O159_00140 [Leifsonia xyli subsp. cynodontis DSM 46306]|uniref:Uncharacterized protein n=1 Tax=Leifsonia xyli subsp. cynodontis DSM 46306 TaxID=1389489 RepID=U3PA22_LEIXC|nr:hypothetical protein O159_00140 [Leifsonia xyli subsp. cynodontis DSM 46306]
MLGIVLRFLVDSYLSSRESTRSASGFAAGLTGRAVLQRGVCENHLADGVSADGTGLARSPVNTEAGLLLGLEFRGGEAVSTGERLPERRLDGGIEPIEFVIGQSGGLEGGHLRDMQDLVGVGVADSGDEALVAEDAFDLGTTLFGEDGGENVPCECGVERIGSEPGDAGDLGGIADHGDRQALLGAGLCDVESAPVLQHQAGRQRSLRRSAGGCWRRTLTPADPARAGEVDDEV